MINKTRVYLVMILKRSIAAVAVMISLTILPSAVQAKWKIIEPFSDNVEITAATSITVDANNKVHILFSDKNILRYLTNSGASGAWVTQIIDSNNGKPQGDIIVDSTGVVHLSYYVPQASGVGGDLMYATDGSSVLVSTVIESSVKKNGVGQWNSIAIDGDSTLHVSYYDSSSTQLMHTKKSSGSSWISEVVDSGNPGSDVGGYSSIAVDDNGTLHVSYYDFILKQLKYATNSNGAWRTDVVENGGAGSNVGQYSSIAVDTKGKIHISYYDFGNNQLKYATYSNGTWNYEIVDSAGVGQYSSIVATSDGSKIAISYWDSNNGTLKYAERISDSWRISTIDSDNNTGKFSAMDLDSLGNSYISYYYEDNTTTTLKLRIAYQYNDPVLPVVGSDGGGGCFLSTIFMGTPFESSLRTLRSFRDKILDKYFIGRKCINAYYRYSAQVTTLIKGHQIIQTVIYWCLMPVVAVSWSILSIGLLPVILLGCILSMVYFYGVQYKKVTVYM